MRNNLKFASRYLWRNKTSSLLNIAGLSLGITSALLLYLFIRHELSYDTFHEKKDRIYRVCMELTRQGNTDRGSALSLAAKRVLEEEFPQIEKSTTVFYQSGATFIIDPDRTEGALKKFKQELGTAYVQPSFYEMFDFKWAIGDYKKVLSEPNSAAISKSIAEKFFGVKDGRYRDVIGRTMKMNNQVLLTVNGVIEDPPANSDFPFEVVVSQITHYNNNKGEYETWWSI
ncbi:MAG TPA: ABC transporter permease, partial [Ignavibacteriales bacterium]|nr:ABC transporter permease [Ignavibacteriales bacterium]